MSRIAYDLTRLRAVAYDLDGVLSPSLTPLDDDGKPRRMANVKDAYAIQHAAKHGILQAIITGADLPGIARRYHSLGVEDVYVGASLKLPVLQQWMRKHGLQPDEVAYVGDDIPDLPAMRAVGLAVAPRDAAAEVRRTAAYVSPVDGGHGVARDLLEQLLAARGCWMDDTHAFVW